MPGIDNSHQHVSSDIMQVDDPHTPISPSGAPQTVQLLGPYTVTFDMAGLADEVKVADLDTGAIVIRAWAEMVVEFNGGPSAADIIVGVGGPDWGPPDEDYQSIWYGDNGPTGSGNGYVAEPSNSGIVPPMWGSRVVRVTGATGALVARVSGLSGGTTQGEFVVYALIATPA